MIIFIDTNILLHFSPLEQVDWKELVGAKKVKLLFAPIVISELDKKKRDTNKRISKRAKSFLNKLDDVSTVGKLNNMIEIEIITQRPSEDIYNRYFLDKEEKDDKLLATILAYKIGLSNQISLLTDDSGLKLKCKSLRIKTYSLPEKYELKEEENESEKEIRKLREQINRYANRIPKLSLSFSDNNKFFKITLRDIDYKEYIDTRLNAIKQQYPHLEKGVADHKSTIPLSFLDPPPNALEINNYNLRLTEFYNDYENYLKDSEDYFKRLLWTESIEFKLINKVVPAIDIDVKLHFPDGVTLNTDIEDIPNEPQPPLKPGERSTFNMNILSGLPRNPELGRIRLKGEGFASIRKTNIYEVEYDLDTLKHNKDFVFEKLYITFNEYESANGFSIPYQIFASNVPDIVSGELNLLIEKE